LVHPAASTEIPTLSLHDALPISWAVPSASVGDAHPYTRAIAHPGGWRWRIPLQHRMGNGLVFSTEYTDPEEALDEFLGAVEGERSEEHTSELQSRENLVCRLLLE